MNSLTMPPVAPVPFDGLVTFAWIGVFLVVGMILRAVFPVFRKYLIPACIIGGTVGLVCQNLGLLDATGFGYNRNTMQLIVFHIFNLTWVFVGLRVPVKEENAASSSSRKAFWATGLLMMLSTLGAVVVGVATATLALVGLNDGPGTLGFLTSQAFVTGPAQSLVIANIWQGASTFTGLPDYALASGAMGFAVAILVGIPLLNIIARKKKIDLISCPTEEEACGFYNECSPMEEAGVQTTSSTSIDVLAWHIGIGLATYFLAYVIAVLIYLVSPPVIQIVIWSLFFIFTAMVGIVVRTIIVKINKGHLLCSGINTRITNSIVDFLICSTFMSITIGNFAQYMIPFFVSCVAVTLVVGVVLWMFTRRLKEDGAETFAYLFGNLTGTTSTAFILLRLLDPQGHSSVPLRMAIASGLNLPIAIITTNFIHFEVVYGNSAWAAVGLMALPILVAATLLFLFRLPKNKVAWQSDE